MPITTLERNLQAVVDRRRSTGLLRTLTVQPPGSADFCSNDYIGFARCPKLILAVDREIASRRETDKQFGTGSTGSRLLSGNSEYYEETEEMLTDFHTAESALLFNSGFDANFAFFAYVPFPGDIVIYDELVHASVREGIRAGRAQAIPFKHNQMNHLRHVLQEIVKEDAARFTLNGALTPLAVAGVHETKRRNIIIAVETVYSMDGHLAPLVELCDIADQFGASLVADEAHGTGVYGQDGRGLANELDVESRIFCRVHTFGKGTGAHGAVVLGPTALRDYLVNYARPLIYSTSMPPHSVAVVRCAYAEMRVSANARQRHLKDLISLFRERLQGLPPGCVLQSSSPIQGLIVPGNNNCVEMASVLLQRGFYVLPIRSPTVPKGTERLRIVLHYHNTMDEINSLMDSIEELLPPMTPMSKL